ncbi:hypothetical protein Ga0609869_000472 [Rhodovulum iodosum]|uniref:Uncharacterized protein n=1 Tax=Rhodovulum iodosum TaxID=68291 RepID=A0ABV3XPH7_9RHOB|nr:hypothetical protein [Rhodovulum robiginosum]
MPLRGAKFVPGIHSKSLGAGGWRRRDAGMGATIQTGGCVAFGRHLLIYWDIHATGFPR